MDDLDPREFINHRERFAPPRRLEPTIDNLISAVVGKKIYASDPRVLRLVAKYKSRKRDENQPDNFLQNPQFIRELKEELNKSL